MEGKLFLPSWHCCWLSLSELDTAMAPQVNSQEEFLTNDKENGGDGAAGDEREKSATKEAISILEEYIGHADCHVSEQAEPCDVKNAVKKRKLCSETSENSEEAVTDGNSYSVSESTGSIVESSSSQSKMSENVEKPSNLSLVKLSRSGLLFFKFPSGGLHVVEMLTEIFHSLRCGKLKSPQWCHRILPIQETCVLSEKDLHATVSKLFLDFSRNKGNQDDHIKFAVAYNRRGIDETEVKPRKNTNEGSNQQETLMDREQCFKVVAAAVKSVFENSVVDLKSPEVNFPNNFQSLHSYWSAFWRTQGIT
nr:unnamed protein product [Digitaria exilis]